MKNNHVSGKLDHLKSILEESGPLTVAFSGGVDSTFLLHVAARILGHRVQAVIAKTPVFSRYEDDEARAYLDVSGISFHVVTPDLMHEPGFIENGKNRCYVCKACLFASIIDKAVETRKPLVAHGVNRDDLQDYRPGLKAAAELGVISPLADAGFTKQDIRDASQAMGLQTWDKPAMACLATRIPYGDPLTVEKLKTIEQAEGLLRSLGFEGGRARHHGDLVRIEVAVEDLEKTMAEPVRTKLIKGLKRLDFLHVSLDMEGYTQGSLNRILFR